MPIKLFPGRVTSDSDAEALAKRVNKWEEDHVDDYEVKGQKLASSVLPNGDLTVTIMVRYEARPKGSK
jgi:hypothetical protein